MKQAYLSITFLLLALVVTLPAQAKTPAPADTTLLDDLLAYWSLDESSGTRYDSHTRDVDLADHDTVTAITGIQGNAAFFDETNGTNGAYLSGDAADYDTLALGTGDYALAFWARVDTLFGQFNGFFSTGAWSTTNPGVNVAMRDANGAFYAFISDGNIRKDLSVAGPSLDTWFFAVVNYDRDGDMTIYLDGVEKGSLDISALADSSIVGNRINMSPQFTERLHGAMDEMGVWGRTLTQSEITWLYNVGNGRTYGDIVGLKDSLLAYWPLDESSGTRYDSHTRDVDLSDVDTVTAIAGIVDDAAFFDAATTGGDGSYLNGDAADYDTLAMGTGDYAVAFWGRADSLFGQYNGFFSTGAWSATNPGVNVAMRDANGAFYAFLSDGNTRKELSVAGPSLKTWFFAVVNFDRDGDMTVYLDGVEKGSVDISTLADSSIVGNRLTFSAEFTERLRGAMDEAGVWGRTLTQSEITWLYNSGNGRTYGDFCTDASTCNTGSGSQARGGELTLDAPTDELPQTLSLGHYPNPFNPQATITYDLPTDAPVRLEVFDLLGRRVALLVDAPVRAGTHQVRFDGSRLASGLYLYRMQALGQVRTGRMLLVK